MEQIKWELKTDATPQGKDDFWYDLNNGYIKPEEVLKNEAQIAMLDNAVKTINSFERLLQVSDLLTEM